MDTFKRISTHVRRELHGNSNDNEILSSTNFSPFTVYQVLPLIRESKGRIVNVASIGKQCLSFTMVLNFLCCVAGRIGLPTQPAYCASKYAVEAYSDVLRGDMLNWGVTVHIIEPGVFNKTGLYSSFQTGLDKKWEELSPKLKEDYGEAYYKNVSFSH